MIQAQLMGKVSSSVQNSEDVLTSTIFGLLRYLPDNELLIEIFNSARNLEKQTLQIKRDELIEVDYYFWPKLANSEPDLILTLKYQTGEVHLICIEAKYFSGKSSIEDETVDVEERTNAQRDQIGREIEDILNESTCLTLGLICEDRSVKRSMIYLTFESYIPYEDLESSLEAVAQRPTVKFKNEDLYWLSWRHFQPVVSKFISKYNNLVITDLNDFLVKKNMVAYQGFDNLQSVGMLNWSYSTKTQDLTWDSLKNVSVTNYSFVGRNMNGRK
ncbi:hypothetical protein [Evansella tamaricis]|uniref:NERD domain-containing protein n=1 Tax=Evansella tamaricis TaxID=2069301 RepID=A0ABS6JGL9_9BACI|nr:hypothetical protein [Evansella tamaricis]MBU9711605.1 hypothetical protein [Evansella tamaricis]